jgi:hypothetical protein
MMKIVDIDLNIANNFSLARYHVPCERGRWFVDHPDVRIADGRRLICAKWKPMRLSARISSRRLEHR